MARALIDLDDIEELRVEARRAKVRLNAQRYIGLHNLLDLAMATCMDLRREEAELHAAATRDYRSEAERSAARRWVRPSLARTAAIQDDLAAMTNRLRASPAVAAIASTIEKVA